MTKYPKYQDYVIRDGKFIGEFDQMYKDFEDPWFLSTDYEKNSPNRLLALDWIKRLQKDKKDLRVIDMGCGLGHFVSKLKKHKIQALGVDISKTAIKKAKELYPNCKYRVTDLLDFEVYERFRPDVIVMDEITWYILDKLELFIRYIREKFPNIYLIHLLVTYAPGAQKYGTDFFTDFEGILKYFNMNILEAEDFPDKTKGSRRTFFIGKFQRS